MVCKQRLPPTGQFDSRVHDAADQTSDTHMSCAPTLESISSPISCVPCSQGLGFQANDCPKVPFFVKTTSSKLDEESVEIFLSFLGIYLSRFELQNLDKSLESTAYRRWKQKIMLLESWKKLKNKIQVSNLNSSSFPQLMTTQHVYAKNWLVLSFLGTDVGVADCDWLRNFFKNRDGFSFS